MAHPGGQPWHSCPSAQAHHHQASAAPAPPAGNATPANTACGTCPCATHAQPRSAGRCMPGNRWACPAPWPGTPLGASSSRRRNPWRSTRSPSHRSCPGKAHHGVSPPRRTGNAAAPACPVKPQPSGPTCPSHASPDHRCPPGRGASAATTGTTHPATPTCAAHHHPIHDRPHSEHRCPRLRAQPPSRTGTVAAHRGRRTGMVPRHPVRHAHQVDTTRRAMGPRSHHRPQRLDWARAPQVQPRRTQQAQTPAARSTASEARQGPAAATAAHITSLVSSRAATIRPGHAARGEGLRRRRTPRTSLVESGPPPNQN
jgi:hypothetical protein